MEMTDMGSKSGGMTGAISGKSTKDDMNYPSVYLSGKMPDGMMAMDTGSYAKFVIMGKVMSKENSESNGKKSESMRLEIHKMGLMSKETPKGKSKRMV